MRKNYFHLKNITVDRAWRDPAVRLTIKELYDANWKPNYKGLRRCSLDYWSAVLLHKILYLLGHRGYGVWVEIYQSEESSSSTASKAVE